MESAKIKAFVIGPIGDRDAEEGSSSKLAYEDAIEVFENIIEPACHALDVVAFRADHINRSGDIHDQIYRNLRDSHIVIADLTGANPNVMYELGLRHTTGKLTFQIGERDRLPFDISTIRTILFKRSNAGFVSAKRALIATLAEGLEHGSDPVAAERIWFEFPDEENEIDTELEIPPEEDDDELGFLEQIADTEIGIVEIGTTLVRGTGILEEITSFVTEGAKKMEDIPESPNYSTQKLKIANQIATNLQSPAIRLKMVAQDFKNHVDLTSPGMEYMLKAISQDPTPLKEAPEFIEQILGLINAAQGTVEGSGMFAKSMKSTGDSTRLMRKVTSSICHSTLSIQATSKKIVSWKSLIKESMY